MPLPRQLGTGRALIWKRRKTAAVSAPANAIKNTTAGYVLNVSGQYVLNTG